MELPIRPSKRLSTENTQSQRTLTVKDAINDTLRTIECRARIYHKLVVSVSILSILSFILCFIFRSLKPCMGLTLIVPFIGVYLYLDQQLVGTWRKSLLEMWRCHNLSLQGFEQAITSLTYIPPKSLRGMLSTLPKADNTQRDHLRAEEKKEMVENLEEVSNRQMRQLLLGVVSLIPLFGFFIGTVVFRTTTLFLFFAVSVVLLVVFKKLFQS